MLRLFAFPYLANELLKPPHDIIPSFAATYSYPTPSNPVDIRVDIPTTSCMHGILFAGFCFRAYQSEGKESVFGPPGLLRSLLVEERRGEGRRPRLLLRSAEMRAHHAFWRTCLQGRSAFWMCSIFTYMLLRVAPPATVPQLNTSLVRAGISIPHPLHDHSNFCTNMLPTARKSRSNSRHRSACCS